MPALSFEVEGVEAVPIAATPLLGVRLRVTNAVSGEPIHSVALRCQIQIEVTRRQYTSEEKHNLLELFGEPPQWGQTLRAMHWTHVSTTVPGFVGSTVVELQPECTFDFNVAATKYFYGLTTGEIPLCLMFSGTVFYAGADGALQVSRIAWDQEARCRVPVKVWREMIDIYYPNTSWLCLRRDAFERLYQYKTQHGMLTWEQAIESLLPVTAKDLLQ